MDTKFFGEKMVGLANEKLYDWIVDTFWKWEGLKVAEFSGSVFGNKLNLISKVGWRQVLLLCKFCFFFKDLYPDTGVVLEALLSNA